MIQGPIISQHVSCTLIVRNPTTNLSHEVFALCILLVIWTPSLPFGQETPSALGACPGLELMQLGSCREITPKSNQLNNSIQSLGLKWTWCVRPPCCMHQVIPKLHRQEYQMIEFFAGNAHLSRCMRASGYSTASFDILYTDGRRATHGSNFMDILSESGFAYFGFTDH